MTTDQQKRDQEAAIASGKRFFGEDRWNYSGEYSDFKECWLTAYKSGIAHRDKNLSDEVLELIEAAKEYMGTDHDDKGLSFIAYEILSKALQKFDSHKSQGQK